MALHRCPYPLELMDNYLAKETDDTIKLRTLSWGEESVLSRWAQSNQMDS